MNAEPAFFAVEGETARTTVAGEEVVLDRSGAAYLPALALLCVSDLHLEKGSSFAARRGVLMPPYDTVATLLRLQAVVDRYRPRMVISLGDSFHDQGGSARLPEPLRLDLSALAAGRDWFWIAGNHDPDAPCGLPGDTVQEIAVGNLVFRHEPIVRASSGEVAGHLHPCARIVQRGRSVRRRCFAADGGRLVMPAFGAFTGSLNVLDRAYAGLFRRDGLMAYMIGSQRIYSIAGAMLRPG